MKTQVKWLKDISVDAAVAEFLSEPDGIFTLKEELRTALMAFFDGKDVFALPLSGFSW